MCLNPKFGFSISILLKNLPLARTRLSVLNSSHVTSSALVFTHFALSTLGFFPLLNWLSFYTFLGCSHILSSFFTCLVLESDSSEPSNLRLTGVSHLVLRITLKGRYCGSHFTDEKPEVKSSN